jgi:hypothetical protein
MLKIIAPGLASRLSKANRVKSDSFKYSEIRSRSAGINAPGRNRQFTTQALQSHIVRATPNSVLSVSIVDPFYDIRMNGKIAS